MRDKSLSGEETASSPEKRASSRKSGAESTGAYSSLALRKSQPLLLDAAPTRRWTLLVIFLLGASAVVALMWMHAIATTWLPLAPFGSWRMFDARRPNALAAWFSSSLMLVAAFYSVQVFLLRRHRTDDYRGRYRVWLWTAAFSVLASVAASTMMHEAVNAALHISLGQRIASFGGRAALLVMAPLITLWFIRLAVEMRSSTGGLLALGASWLVYALAAALQIATSRSEAGGVWFGLVPALDTALLANCAGLVSRMFFLFGVFVYCRQVVLESQGLLAAPSRSTSRQSAAAKESKAAAVKRKRNDLDHPVVASESSDTTPTKKKTASAKTPLSARVQKNAAPVTSSSEVDYSQGENDPLLSKAERRRLRKLKRREGRAA